MKVWEGGRWKVRSVDVGWVDGGCIGGGLPFQQIHPTPYYPFWMSNPAFTCRIIVATDTMSLGYIDPGLKMDGCHRRGKTDSDGFINSDDAWVGRWGRTPLPNLIAWVKPKPIAGENGVKLLVMGGGRERCGDPN